VLGFPVGAWYFLRKHRFWVKADQIARAKGLDGRNPLMPRDIYRFRVRWHRL